MISAHPEAGFFHGSAWARVLHQTYGHRPWYACCGDPRQPLALLPLMEVDSALTGRRGVCLPFTDLCGPLVFDEAAALASITGTLRDLARERRWRHFEVRGPGSAPVGALPSTTFYGHTLDLRAGPEPLFAGFDGSVRRAIRKAERCGLGARIVHTREAVREFYRLHVQTRRRHGAPPQPIAFFFRIWEEVIKPGLGFVALAMRQARPVAAAVYFCRAGRAIYKFGASDEAFQEERPNNLAMWEGIRHLCGLGARSLHFGRTSLHHEGLRRFKLAWGAKEERMEYFQFDLKNSAWAVSRDKTAGFHTAVFRRLPSVLNRLAGTVLYPHLD